jgi:hypothetical protein
LSLSSQRTAASYPYQSSHPSSKELFFLLKVNSPFDMAAEREIERDGEGERERERWRRRERDRKGGRESGRSREKEREREREN